MSGAGAGLAARADLAIFGDVLPKQVRLFIVNRQGFICTELTKFWFRKEAAFPPPSAEPKGLRSSAIYYSNFVFIETWVCNGFL